MKVQILELLEGARRAAGTTVIIDVYRAFTLEAYLFANGVSVTHPIGSLDDAFALKKMHPDWLLFGERGGAQVEGCDFGNSPDQILKRKDLLPSRTVIHSTSAGTQGIVNASGASEILGGSLVNADAIIRYLKTRNPDQVSLVAMGRAGLEHTEEDLVCAQYIRAGLAGDTFDMDGARQRLEEAAAQFYDPAKPQFPPEDAPLCNRFGIFDFVIPFRKENGLWTGRAAACP